MFVRTVRFGHEGASHHRMARVVPQIHFLRAGRVSDLIEGSLVMIVLRHVPVAAHISMDCCTSHDVWYAFIHSIFEHYRVVCVCFLCGFILCVQGVCHNVRHITRRVMCSI